MVNSSKKYVQARDPAQLLAWATDDELVRPPESDSWIAAGLGLEQAQEAEIEVVLAERGDALAQAIEQLRADLVAADRIGVEDDSGRNVFERDLLGLVSMTLGGAAGRYATVRVRLAVRPRWYAGGRLITGSGAGLITSTGSGLAFVQEV